MGILHRRGTGAAASRDQVSADPASYVEEYRDAEAYQRLLAQLVGRRKELGLSQVVVASRMGTTQSAVSQLEAFGVDPRVSTLQRYARALDCELEIWFGARHSPPSHTYPLGPSKIRQITEHAPPGRAGAPPRKVYPADLPLSGTEGSEAGADRPVRA